ncbi:unnamed protein product [Dicrocoelium dendriticum]|nr:unnamed protein product [Dicrocoelium dendriticum]
MDTDRHVSSFCRLKDSEYSTCSNLFEVPKNSVVNHALSAPHVPRRHHSDVFSRNSDAIRNENILLSKNSRVCPLSSDGKAMKRGAIDINGSCINSLDVNAHERLFNGSETCEDSYTISIHETYQLGYCGTLSDKGDSDLYVFDFVDGLEVSYPVTVPASDSLPFDLPPLFVEPDYVHQLTALASTALSQLAQLLNNWLVACQAYDEQVLIWQHLTAHEEAVQLRKLIVELLSDLSPQCDLRTRVDLQSPSTDRILSRLTSALTMDIFGSVSGASQDTQPDLSIPIVSLCPDPNHCVSVLRGQIVALLKQLLPQLDLPQSFDYTRDLQPLLATVRDLNRKVTV